jgi:hypothetical protein
VSRPGFDGREADRVDWLLLGALGMMWVVFLLPMGRKGRSPRASVKEFERGLELLAVTGTHGAGGRWIVTPHKGMRFVGTAERSRARARARRRQVFTILLEAIGITFLIGLAPPLRPIWVLTAVLGGLLVLYVFLLLTIKHQAQKGSLASPAGAARPAAASAAIRPTRYAAEGATAPRATFNGLGAVHEGERVHVVVRTADARA